MRHRVSWPGITWCAPVLLALLVASCAAAAADNECPILPSDPPPVADTADCPSTPDAVPPDATQPANLDLLKRQLINYKCFGAYDQDVSAVIEHASAYVTLRAGQAKNPALVLDIDETSLSNWQRMKADDFAYIAGGACSLNTSGLPNSPCGAQCWELRSRAPAIRQTLDLFNAAKRQGVAIYFITGRPENNSERAATEKNLRAAGYDGWAALYLRPPGYGSVADFKMATRKKIAESHTIIANIGDQKSDLRGGFAEQTFKLPNPFYFLP